MCDTYRSIPTETKTLWIKWTTNTHYDRSCLLFVCQPHDAKFCIIYLIMPTYKKPRRQGSRCNISYICFLFSHAGPPDYDINTMCLIEK